MKSAPLRCKMCAGCCPVIFLPLSVSGYVDSTFSERGLSIGNLLGMGEPQFIMPVSPSIENLKHTS